MAKAGDSIESPFSGAHIRFLKTARDTNGELLQVEDLMKGGGRVPIEQRSPLYGGAIRDHLGHGSPEHARSRARRFCWGERRGSCWHTPRMGQSERG